jgi:hypothetical protein
MAWVFFSTFFGGSSSSIWEASKDEHATFDEFIVSNQRIDYPGIPPDVDGDGIPNDWEIAYFGSDTGARAADDSDHNGSSNLEEYIAGTNPLDASDRFRMTMAADESGMLRLETAGKTGRRYKLQRSTDLSSWTDVSETAPLAEDRKVDFLEAWKAGPSFYRIGVSMP